MRSAAILSALGLVLGCAAANFAAATAPKQPEVYVKLPSRGSFAGTVANGVADGQFSNGDTYKGGWKDGKPDGVGTMRYALGGAYEGEWKNGLRNGKGVMSFSGSGRRAEVRFADDRRIDVAVAPAPPAPTATRFFLLSDEEITGSHIRNKLVYSPLPLDRGFDELTPEQQRLVRSYYPALDAGDDPPYPLKGGKELYKLLESMIRYHALKDDVLVYVAVDADGKVSSVSAASLLDPKFREMVATAAGLLKYKPAQCGGQPCPGVVPFNLKLHINALQ
jgi:hypothetical protein